ncbi:1043_t:CDS:2 [Acaulospora colombiana]|uniref:1043_t:CDS:1 n=1 Tax=Acaulospora colombiana TaxID=27376 RepID=A0ACA9MHK5_9GLOM|nr:1043_t:CDS:2 [Acaulospora colombiana]
MSKMARVTLVGSAIICGITVWGVHYLQRKELDVSPRHPKDMYKGVLRDDERRAAKMKERQEQLMESQRKQAIYETVQKVGKES